MLVPCGCSAVALWKPGAIEQLAACTSCRPMLGPLLWRRASRLRLGMHLARPVAAQQAQDKAVSRRRRLESSRSRAGHRRRRLRSLSRCGINGCTVCPWLACAECSC